MASEERTEEYRVVGERVGFNGPVTIWPSTRDRQQAESDLAKCRRIGFPGTSSIRLQTRTTTVTSWTDLIEEPHTDE